MKYVPTMPQPSSNREPQQMTQWRVAWRSRITAATGHGTWLDDGIYVNSLVCRENDGPWPLHHWCETREVLQ